jgi:ATP-dependent RNA helicase DeaD
MKFKDMGLSPEILMGIEELGFSIPTPIQEKVIPALMEKNRDIIGLAQTGTGKTAAFGLPALESINIGLASPQLLVLSPTRELCLQITKDLASYGKFMKGFNIVAVYGGAPMDQQIRTIKRGVHVVVATPGRIHDLIRRNCIDLAKISTVVLDEADEMLKMGFRDDLDAILAQTPVEKNTLLFSATMAPGIAAIARKYMHDPLEITVGQKNAGAENISHIFHVVQARDRYNALKRVVDYHPGVYGIVFCRTRQETKDVASRLMIDGYNAEALHGDLTQAQRDYVMKKFRERNLNLLVATDVAARGLDVNDLTHIINYSLPDDNEVYTHRSGRTGRAGKEGLTVSIVGMKERYQISRIESTIRKRIEQKPVPTGSDICERQLFNMVEKMQNSVVNHKQIDPYMDKVYEILNDLPKEEIIKNFVSLEFNRFLDYYKSAPDLNVSAKPVKNTVSRELGRDTRKSSMSRVLFNIGKGKNITKREIIDLVAGTQGAKNMDIGQIEIYKRTSTVEVDRKLAGKIIGELNRTIYKGIRIEAEENQEFAGNDFRDRNKGSRGRKRINAWQAS